MKHVIWESITADLYGSEPLLQREAALGPELSDPAAPLARDPYNHCRQDAHIFFSTGVQYQQVFIDLGG